MTATITDAIMAGAAAERARARAELRLLACIAPIGRWGVALAAQAGIRRDHFAQPDADAIYAALLAADEAGAIRDRLRTAQMIRAALRAVGLWVADDARRHVAGMRWGDGAIAAILCRVGPAEAEAMLPSAAAELLALAGERGNP